MFEIETYIADEQFFGGGGLFEGPQAGRENLGLFLSAQCGFRGNEQSHKIIGGGRVSLEWVALGTQSNCEATCCRHDRQQLFTCAERVRQLEGESPFDNLMEVKS